MLFWSQCFASWPKGLLRLHLCFRQQEEEGQEEGTSPDQADALALLHNIAASPHGPDLAHGSHRAAGDTGSLSLVTLGYLYSSFSKEDKEKGNWSTTGSFCHSDLD